MGGCLSSGARAMSGAIVLFLVSLQACSSKPDVLDLARNERIYQDPRYKARLPVDRAAFVMPIDDQRSSRPADASAPTWPRRMMPEEIWNRPMPEMLDEVLARVLVSGGVVARIDTRVPPAPEVIVVQPALLDARGYLEEQAAGRCTLATVALRIVVLSPEAADGSRTRLFEQTYEQSSGSQVMRTPTPIPDLFGRCLRDAMVRMLGDLDRSNVARSGMPQPVK